MSATTGATQSKERPNARSAIKRLGGKVSTPPLILLFLISAAFPIFFQVGPTVLHGYRIALLTAFFPCIFLWLTGKAGKIRAPDLLLVLFVLWASLSLIRAHGISSSIEPTGVLIVETIGAYLLGRVFVRDAKSFYATSRLIFLIVLALLPLAIVESTTSYNVVLRLLRPFANVPPDSTEEVRWGLHRSHTVFVHPIHYGIFCASSLGLTLFVIAKDSSMGNRLARGGAIGLATFLSLSTGAIVAIIAQAGIVVWDSVLRRVKYRWRLLAWLTLFTYVLIDLISNRTPFHVFVTYLTFNITSSYNRILIWNYGTAEVMRNPIFGIGLLDWERPEFMSASMDNFWLVTAVRHGLPGFVLFVLPIVIIMAQLGRKKLNSATLDSYRKGILVSLGGLIIAGATVHYWHHIYALLLFLVGSAVWMLDHRTIAGEQRLQTESRKAIRSKE